ncbi:MAG: aspartate--tRNA ligase [Candidatus Nanopelagicales bacterium]|nr:aspartate--tRNA ligase [Candidatus Nanopelagicales bacterium]MCF8551097.1 aspartate--tRNA ligase [Candidatus Nanopelagicales bacterium]
MIRTALAGNLSSADVGKDVVLAGWVASRRDHGGVAFLDLRDSSGIAQVVVRDTTMAHDLRDEYCIAVTGTVELRPEGNSNPDIASGDIEVITKELTVLSESAPLPFQIDDRTSVNDEIRLKYRYLDLRRKSAGDALRMRSKVSHIARNVLFDEDFVEVETPTLTRSTPEGARDFLVPVRLKPGHWYALPQSPQLFKQLLMVGGMERYFQIARCYRDEDFRSDRQPEFTQLDIEMSFVNQEDVIDVGEKVIKSIWSGILDYSIGDIPHMTYHEAMRRFGSDKPDLRFGLELVDLTEFFASTPFRVFQADYVGAVVMPGGADQPRRAFDAWQEWAKQRGAKGLAYVTVTADGLGGPVAKNITDQERDALAAAAGAQVGDCIFFAAGRAADARALLGALRNEIADRLQLIDTAEWSFVWIVDAPMFEEVQNDAGEWVWTAVHHPFTSPNAEWLRSFQDSPGEALAWAYDLVCNGNEIGGGSIRIHQADIQSEVFRVLGISEHEAQEKFGFLLEAFAYGPPPHGGIAFGWDRICMLLAGANSLRDVIAFPKTGGGHDPLTGAPTAITVLQRREAGIDAKPQSE